MVAELTKCQSVASTTVITTAVDVLLYIIYAAPSSSPTISLYFIVDYKVCVQLGCVGVRGGWELVFHITTPHSVLIFYLLR